MPTLRALLECYRDGRVKSFVTLVIKIFLFKYREEQSASYEATFKAFREEKFLRVSTFANDRHFYFEYFKRVHNLHRECFFAFDVLFKFLRCD